MKTASHSPANKFLMDFGGILRRKVLIFQVKSRRKTRKFIAAELMGSALFGYPLGNALIHSKPGRLRAGSLSAACLIIGF